MAEAVSDMELAGSMRVLSDALPPLFHDLCPACLHAFRTRLADIASGLQLSAYFKENLNGMLREANSWADRDGNHMLHICASEGDETRKQHNHHHADRDEITSRRLRFATPAEQFFDRDEEAVKDARNLNLRRRRSSYDSDSDREEHLIRASEQDVEDSRASFASSVEEKQRRRMLQVVKKDDFVCTRRVRGKTVNIVEGLELHCNVFTAAEQARLVDMVYELQDKGIRGELMERTFDEPRGSRGRVRIQFGCCYNYGNDGTSPGIVPDEEVDPMPPMIKGLIKRLVRWGVLPADCVPDSCIVNIYEEGACIPPHIDHHDFLRPFCTISLLSECSILFGTELQSLGNREFEGDFAIPLPVGSVLVLNGNGADVAKHCVPAVPTKRISITCRKMDPRKTPWGRTSRG